VIATSKDEVQDVSWRYSANFKALKANRKVVRPSWLINVVLQATKKLQENYSMKEKRRLLKRRLLELVELMQEKESSSLSEPQGRQSGSLAWRLSRGETGGVKSVVWRPNEGEIAAGVFCLEYDVVKDRYWRKVSEEEVKGWRNGVKESENVFRKVETDWKMTYLARSGEKVNKRTVNKLFSIAAGSSKASISWELDLEESDFSVRSIELEVNSQTYENGRVLWTVCGGNACLLPTPGNVLDSDGLAGAKKVTLTATMSGGKGDVAWQHTQLFRARNEDDRPQMRLVVKLARD